MVNETCDRCPHPAAYFVTRGMHRLFFCTACSIIRFAAFATQGWVFHPVGYQVVAPQATEVRRFETWLDRDPWTPQDS